MDRVAVGLDRRVADGAVFVLHIPRLDDCGCSAFYSFFKSVIRIFDLKRDVAHTVTVLFDMFGGRMVRMQRGRQYEIDVVLLQQIARRLAIPRLQTGVRRPRKAESLSVIKLRLLCIADVKLNVVNFLEAKRVLDRRVYFNCCVCFCDHD